MTDSPSAPAPTPESAPRRVDLGRIFSGTVMIAIGGLIWLELGDGLALIDLLDYWPILLIIGGLSGMLSDRACSGGWVLAVIGIGLLLFNLGYAPWPVLLVGIGLVLVIRGLREGVGFAREGDGHA